MKDQSEIYFAGGCFWGTEHFLKQIGGVESTLVGYANGNIANPTYEQVCSGNTNFAETVKVTYDPRKVRLPLLIDLYFKTIDPTSVNRQGNDHGSQYRTGIYYTDPADLPVIQSAVKTLAEKYSKPLAVEIKPLANFYKAELFLGRERQKASTTRAMVTQNMMAESALMSGFTPSRTIE